MGKDTKNKISLSVLVIFSVILTIYLLFLNYTMFLIIPLMKALYLLFSFFTIGYFISFLSGKNFNILEKIGIGLIFTSFYFYLVSYLRILNTYTIGIYYSFGVISFYFVYKKNKLREFFSISTFFYRKSSELLIFIIPFVYASLPSTFYDTLVYHLGIPNLYLRNGGFIKTPFFLYANTSIYYELSLIPAVYTGDFVPRLFHFFLSTVFILSFADFSEKYFNLKRKNYLLFLIISMTVSLFLLSTVKNDIIAAMFIFLGISNYLKKRYSLSGVFWGFSIGIKYFSLLIISIFLIFEFIPLNQRKIKKFFLIGITSLIILMPLFIKNYKFTSNPVYPFFNKVFKNSNWDANRNYYLKKDVGKIFHNYKDVLKSFYSLSFKNHGSLGRIGPIFLIFLPFIAIFGTNRLKLVLFALISIFISCFFTGSIRFFYISILFLTPFVIEILEKVNLKLLRIIFFIVIMTNLLTSISIMERIYSFHSLYSWNNSIYTYKVKYFPPYKIYSFINRHTPPKSKFLIVGEARNFYFKRTYAVSSAIDYSLLKPYLNRSQTPEEFFKNIKNDGFSYIFLSLGEFIRLQKEYKRLNKKEMKKFNYFFSTRKPIFKNKMYFIYKL